jgi:transposase
LLLLRDPLELWVRRKRGNCKLECSGCGRKFDDAYDNNEGTVRDLPWSEFKTTAHIEVYRVKCPDCGVKVEKVPLLPSKARRLASVLKTWLAKHAKCFGAAGGAAVRIAGKHDTRDRSAVSGAMGRDEAQAGAALWFGRERKKKKMDA